MQNYLYKDLYKLEDKHWWHLAKRKLILNLIAKYLNNRRLTILDVGCGTGKNLEELNKFGEAWGIDLSKKAINFCKKRGLKNLKVSSSEKINFNPNTFDLVTLLDLLEHTNDNKTLREIRKVTKKGGILVVTVPAFMWLWSKWDEALHHQRRYNKKSLENLLFQNGFKVLEASYFHSYLVVPVLLIRFIKSLLSKKHYSSDFQLSSPLINWLFTKTASMEFLIIKKSSLPFGTSLVAVAQKM